MKANKLLIPEIVFLLILACFASAICVDHTAPTAPSSLSIADSPYDADGDITLTWSAAIDEPGCSGVDHYNIYKSTDNNNFAKIGEATDLSYDDTGLSQGTKYYYYVTAVDKVAFDPHEGPASNTASTKIGTAPANGGGGGGGGGGGYTTADEDWECGDWSECIDGEKTQECAHKYSSATKTNTVSCVEEETGEAGEETLVETTSSAGEEEKEEAGKEVEVLAGGEEEDLGITGAVVGAGSKTPWIFMIILLALIAALLLLLFLRKRRRH